MDYPATLIVLFGYLITHEISRSFSSSKNDNKFEVADFQDTKDLIMCNNIITY